MTASIRRHPANDLYCGFNLKIQFVRRQRSSSSTMGLDDDDKVKLELLTKWYHEDVYGAHDKEALKILTSWMNISEPMNGSHPMEESERQGSAVESANNDPNRKDSLPGSILVRTEDTMPSYIQDRGMSPTPNQQPNDFKHLVRFRYSSAQLEKIKGTFGISLARAYNSPTDGSKTSNTDKYHIHLEKSRKKLKKHGILHIKREGTYIQAVNQIDKDSLLELADMKLDVALRTAMQDAGFGKVAAVQAQLIPYTGSGQDMVVSSPPGSGKTLAFLLFALQTCLEARRPSSSAMGEEDKNADLLVQEYMVSPTVLIVAATRELANQIYIVCHNLCQHLNRNGQDTTSPTIDVVCLTGGIALEKDYLSLLEHAKRDSCNILIGTPGRLASLFDADSVSSLLPSSFSLFGSGEAVVLKSKRRPTLSMLPTLVLSYDSLELIILDEIDKLLEPGLKLDLDRVLELREKGSSKQPQMAVFSATVTSDVIAVLGRWMAKPTVLVLLDKPERHQGAMKLEDVSKHYDVASIEPGETNVSAAAPIYHAALHIQPYPEGIIHAVLSILLGDLEIMADDDGDGKLRRSAAGHAVTTQCIIFWNDKQACRRLVKFITRALGIRAEYSGGDVPFDDRLRIFNAFSQGTMRVLVASDMLSRGADFVHCGLVIHADVPRSTELYMHRTGRTGRFGSIGQSVLICDGRNKAHAKFIALVESVLCIRMERLVEKGSSTERGRAKPESNDLAAWRKEMDSFQADDGDEQEDESVDSDDTSSQSSVAHEELSKEEVLIQQAFSEGYEYGYSLAYDSVYSMMAQLSQDGTAQTHQPP